MVDTEDSLIYAKIILFLMKTLTGWFRMHCLPPPPERKGSGPGFGALKPQTVQIIIKGKSGDAFKLFSLFELHSFAYKIEKNIKVNS